MVIPALGWQCQLWINCHKQSDNCDINPVPSQVQITWPQHGGSSGGPDSTCPCFCFWRKWERSNGEILFRGGVTGEIMVLEERYLFPPSGCPTPSSPPAKLPSSAREAWPLTEFSPCPEPLEVPAREPWVSWEPCFLASEALCSPSCQRGPRRQHSLRPDLLRREHGCPGSHHSRKGGGKSGSCA